MQRGWRQTWFPQNVRETVHLDLQSPLFFPTMAQYVNFAQSLFNSVNAFQQYIPQANNHVQQFNGFNPMRDIYKSGNGQSITCNSMGNVTVQGNNNSVTMNGLGQLCITGNSNCITVNGQGDVFVTGHSNAIMIKGMGSISITGNDNKVNITGMCSVLRVNGSRNRYNSSGLLSRVENVQGYPSGYIQVPMAPPPQMAQNNNRRNGRNQPVQLPVINENHAMGHRNHDRNAIPANPAPAQPVYRGNRNNMQRNLVNNSVNNQRNNQRNDPVNNSMNNVPANEQKDDENVGNLSEVFGGLELDDNRSDRNAERGWDCAVCLGDFTNQTNVVTLPCAHRYVYYVIT